MIWNRVVTFSSERHLHHPGGSVVEIRGIETAWWVVVISKYDGAAVEIEIRRIEGLLPSLKRRHEVEAEFTGEKSDRVAGEVEYD